MNANKHSTHQDFDVDDAPDLSMGDWPEKFAKVSVQHGGSPLISPSELKDGDAGTGYFLVRAVEGGEQNLSVFFEDGVVAVGWSQVRFAEYFNADEVIEAVLEKYKGLYAEVTPQYLGKRKNEIRRFKMMRKGDRVVVPYGAFIRLATATDEELYDESQGASTDLANQRRVIYEAVGGDLLTIPRNRLSEGLSRRVSGRGVSVGDLWEFGPEIDNLFRTQEGLTTRLQKKSDRFLNEFKNQLLENIRKGKTNLAAGGYGLEKLVHELLEIEGYRARILPEAAFPDFADADIHASKADRIVETRLFVQVKHHGGKTRSWGTKQLREIIAQQPNNADHKLVMVTSGDASQKLVEECERHDIVLIDGKGLVDWIYERIGQMSAINRNRLGITDVPMLANLPTSRMKGP
ncbi:MAG: restriction endonuclease [Candidatus Tectomicrobia bacterium]|nr:restriction endonuclease [Candidatus Tectomicrobia bacterium]